MDWRILRAFGLGFVTVFSLVFGACDKFPSNAGVTLLAGVPTVVFRPCSEEERMEGLVLLRWDGSGQNDSDCVETWRAEIRSNESRSPILPLVATDFAFSDVEGALPTFDETELTWRLYVYTSERRVLTGFGAGALREGRVRHEGRDVELEEFLHGSGIC